MKDYIKVVDYDNLYRDPNTGAIINTDKSINSDKKINNAALMKTLYTDIECLKNELSEIKHLLREIIKNG